MSLEVKFAMKKVSALVRQIGTRNQLAGKLAEVGMMKNARCFARQSYYKVIHF